MTVYVLIKKRYISLSLSFFLDTRKRSLQRRVSENKSTFKMRKAENRDNNRGERNAREKAGNVLKNSEVIAVRTCFSLFHARCPLRQRVRDCPRSGIKRKTEIRGMVCGRERGERQKSMGKRRRQSRESEKREQEGREARGIPKLFGVIAVRSRFSPFLPVHNLLLLSRLFLFLPLLLPF